MKLKYVSCFFIFFALSVHSVNFAQEPDSASALKSLVEAERSFAKMSVAQGMRDAFVENLADEAILFRPGPVKGKPVWQERKPSAFALKWEPEFADISASADFGYTTGPWELQEYRPLSEPRGYGYFVSVWKKQADGRFKVALDIGTSNSRPEMNQHTISFPQDADRKKEFNPAANLVAVRRDLLNQDNANLKTWSGKPVAATFLTFLAKDARVYRDSKFPTANIDSIKTDFAEKKFFAWKPIDSDVAVSGELGYTYGSYEIKHGSNAELGYYVRIWKKQADLNWKIVLDLLNPSPPAKN